MTPEGRAADVIHLASGLGLASVQSDGPKWHSLIAAALRDALVEARAACSDIADREAISDLMLGARAEPIAPTSYPAQVQCFVCEGSGMLGSVPCQACRGLGRIVDHGPPPYPNPGMIALKRCGCAVDWIGSGAPTEYLNDRTALWTRQGYDSRSADFSEAGPLITAGAGCQHERRAEPRLSIVPLDTSDLPPGTVA